MPDSTIRWLMTCKPVNSVSKIGAPHAATHVAWCAMVVAWAIVSMSTPDVAWAADALSGIRQDAVVTGDRIDGGHGVLKERVYVDGERVRIDFDAGPKYRGQWLYDGKHAWVQADSARGWLPAAGFGIGRVVRLDPQRPCWQTDWSCAPVEARSIAGRTANGWRYRHAEQGGPLGTDNGEFWLDAGTGLLLAFRGRDLGGHDYRMETIALTFEPLDPALFVKADPSASGALRDAATPADIGEHPRRTP